MVTNIYCTKCTLDYIQLRTGAERLIVFHSCSCISVGVLVKVDQLKPWQCFLSAHMKTASGCFYLVSFHLKVIFFGAEIQRPYRKVNCGQAWCLFFQMPHSFGHIISYPFTFCVWEYYYSSPDTQTASSHILPHKTLLVCWPFCAIKILLITSRAHWGRGKVELRIWWDRLWHASI